MSASISLKYRVAACQKQLQSQDLEHSGALSMRQTHREARERYSIARAARRDEWIAIAVASHPGAEAEERVVDWHPRLPDVGERAVQAAQKTRHTGKYGFLEVAEPAACLVLRRGWAAPDLVCAPGRLHVCSNGALHLQPLVASEARAVQAVQLAASRLEVLEHRATKRLRRVRGEHQVHGLVAQRLIDSRRRDAGI